jgi:hypothetical protein
MLCRPLWWLVPPHVWWQWPLTILSGGLAVLFVAVGVTSFRTQPKAEELTAATDEVVTRGPNADSAPVPPNTPNRPSA